MSRGGSEKFYRYAKLCSKKNRGRFSFWALGGPVKSLISSLALKFVILSLCKEKKLFRFIVNEFGYEFRHEPFGLTMEEAHDECLIIDSIGNLISINEPHENLFLKEQLAER